MACSDNYIHFVCEQLAVTGEVRAKKMFGDWLIYIDEKPVVLACDNQCYVKMLPEIATLMDGALTAPPYPGAKPHYLLDIEHRSEAIKVVKPYFHFYPIPSRAGKNNSTSRHAITHNQQQKKLQLCLMRFCMTIRRNI